MAKKRAATRSTRATPTPKKAARKPAARKKPSAKGVAAKKPVASRKKPAPKKKPAAKKASAKAANIVTSLGQVAAHFERSLNTVKKDWRPVWPASCGKAGEWDLDAISKWRLLQQERSPGASSTSPGEGGEDDMALARRKKMAEVRVKEADAAKRERLEEQARGSVCLRVEVEQFLADLFRFTRDLHVRVSEEMKPEFPRGVRQDLADSLSARLRAVLRSMHVQAQRLVELDDV